MMLKTEELARKIRIHSVQMTHDAHSSHVSSCLSCADILAVLYGGVMKFRPEQPDWEDRDRFIMSKGHAAAALYACLVEVGFFPVEELKTFYKSGRLSGHVSSKVPGVDVSTGSLGHGLSIGCGMALAAKLNNNPYRVYVLLSDGELNEGSTWEAIMFAGQHMLSNLTVIVDYNKLQAMGLTEDIIDLHPLSAKFANFGWEFNVVDGHDCYDLKNALSSPSKAYPNCVIAKTVKGKGVSFMQNATLWHYAQCNDEELVQALRELG